MNPAISITVSGRPAPQGSKSYKGQTKAGRAILVESSKAVRPWREAVRADAIRARQSIDGWAVLDEPLRVDMVFTVPKPAGAPKRRRTWPMRTPDLSKLTRATEDALTDAGVWRDDARVVSYGKLAKVYPDDGDPDALAAPGAVIRIYRVNDPPRWGHPSPVPEGSVQRCRHHVWSVANAGRWLHAGQTLAVCDTPPL